MESRYYYEFAQRKCYLSLLLLPTYLSRMFTRQKIYISDRSMPSTELDAASGAILLAWKILSAKEPLNTT